MRTRRRAPSTAAVVVWCVWAVSALVAAGIAGGYGRRFPYSNDWDVVPVLTGRDSLSLGWLWEQSTDHRLVVPRLVISTLTGLTNGDFRIVVWFDVLLLVGIAAAAVATMRVVRGRTAVADAFFPLLVLAPFQWGLTWSFAVHFTTIAAASLGVLLLMVRFGLDVPVGWQWVALGLALVLVGDGAPGLAMVPGVLVWSSLSAMRLRTSAPRAATALLVAIGAFAVVGALYFVGWRGARHPTPSPDEVVAVALRLASVPGGPRASGLWPLTGLVVGVALVATVVVLALRWSADRDGGDGRRAVALSCFGLAVAALVLAFGFGRGTLTWETEMARQYSGLGIPVAAWVYISWGTARGRARDVAAVALLAVAVGVYAMNVGYMQDRFDDRQRLQQAFERDRCELAPEQLARRYRDFLLLSATPRELDELARDIADLRRDDVGGFGCP
jgi:hypothetical protein